MNSVILSNPGNTTLNLTGSLSASGTITASKVYNAVYNDYAEFYEKANNEDVKYGYVIELNPDTGRYHIACHEDSTLVVGVSSNTYGHIIGGEPLENMEENLKRYIPVGIAVRVRVRITGIVHIGDRLTSAANGCAKTSKREIPGSIIGKLLRLPLVS